MGAPGTNLGQGSAGFPPWTERASVGTVEHPPGVGPRGDSDGAMAGTSGNNQAPEPSGPSGCFAPELVPPIEVVDPGRLESGIVLSSPHSGRVYPARFLQCARLDAAALRRSEDAFVDDLFRPAVRLGVPLLCARFPRAYLDVNREPYELDPRMFEGRLPAYANTRSVRVAGGLGTIARIVGDCQEIYARRLPVEDALSRIEAFHKPYHAKLRQLTDRAVRQFGRTLLIDCHSMPSSPAQGQTGDREGRGKADFVIGDRYGTSCACTFTEAAEAVLRGFGFLVERNKPYAGGYITEHYGTPAVGRHALQIEINRALYMDERTLERGPGFPAIVDHMTELVGELAKIAEAHPVAGRAAAE